MTEDLAGEVGELGCDLPSPVDQLFISTGQEVEQEAVKKIFYKSVS